METSKQFDRASIEACYDKIQSLAPDEALVTLKEVVKDSTDEQVGLFLKIIDQCEKEDFVSFIEENEIPPLQLTTEEMESLQGGVLPFVIGLAAGVIVSMLGDMAEDKGAADVKAEFCQA